MNQAIELKFSAVVHQVSALNWRKNFCPCSTSLPATAHFGQNFGWLLRPHLLEFFFEKNFGEILDLYQLAIGRNFKYLEKKCHFKIFWITSKSTFMISTNKHTYYLNQNKNSSHFIWTLRSTLRQVLMSNIFWHVTLLHQK